MAKHKNTKLHEVECNCIAFFYSVIYFIHENKMQMIPPKYPERASEATPARTLFISGLKSRVMKLPFLSIKMMVKSGLEFILKLTEPLQSCCCPVQKYLPRLAELAWQLSRYLWRGSVNFKINSRPLFTIIFKLKNDNFMTRDFSPLIEWVLTGVTYCNGAILNFGFSCAMIFSFG